MSTTTADRKPTHRPAALGGLPIFDRLLPITRPTMPASPRFVQKRFAQALASGHITNGVYVQAFERETAAYLGVKHAIAVSSCTTGLMLVLRSLGLTGRALLPSFTFCATGHAVRWSGLEPVFVDADPGSFNIDLREVEKALTSKVSCVVAVHVFGNPADAEALEVLCRKKKARLIFDAAHGFGARRGNRWVGQFGDAEVFSLSPTKVLTAGEGGLVTTNDDRVAELVRMGRNYGHPGDYDCRFPGLSARMSEFNAALGLASLKDLERNIGRRNQCARLYKEHLGTLPGISFQDIRAGDRSTFKDFSLLVDQKRFGLSRDQLAAALTAENVDVRKYFDPPLHRQKAYRDVVTGALPVTDRMAARALSLPMYSHMLEKDVRAVCMALHRLHAFRNEIRRS